MCCSGWLPLLNILLVHICTVQSNAMCVPVVRTALPGLLGSLNLQVTKVVKAEFASYKLEQRGFV